MPIIVKESWPNGPLRQFCAEGDCPSSFIPVYDKHGKRIGYAGSYICRECKRPVGGLYQAKDGLWYCPECRDKVNKMPKRTNLSPICAVDTGGGVPSPIPLIRLRPIKDK